MNQFIDGVLDIEKSDLVVLSGDNDEAHLFSALRDYGDVKATLVGHDHLSDFCYKREDIQLCYGGGVGLGRAYGSMYTPRHAALASAAVSSSAALAVSNHAALAVRSSAALAVSSRAALAVGSRAALQCIGGDAWIPGQRKQRLPR
ncbi:hypothetical protein PINS_up016822 [Pythium insidiosum]|nr:hypothetical protein PINS_up016822 [Pythium insidiosum]